MLKPNPGGHTGTDEPMGLTEGAELNGATCHTFGPFDEFDLCDLLCSGFPAEDVEADDSTCLLQSFHGLAVRHLPHIDVVHK